MAAMADGEALYERYKDALKRGHVASLRGRIDEALGAYGEAASIAPERPAPHTSAGTALLRRGRFTEALRSYEVALVLAPRDETAMLGRAQALASLGRRPEAANSFDTLAERRAADGRLADAVDAARRGLELAEGRERRRTLERLIARLREAEPDEPGRLALERALQVLEGSALSTAAPREATGPGAAVDPDAALAAEAASGLVAGPSAADATAPPLVRSALDRELPADADLDQLARLAQAALDAGDAPGALERLLDLAAASRARGHAAAAIDACYLALSLDPDHVDLHLALVQLYDEQGWTPLADEKLGLLDRLVDLDADAGAATRVAAVRAARRPQP
jgi:tetratricopeptide (TPR) repeat protein